MRNSLKHLTLLTRMKDDGLLPVLTGSFSEDAIERCKVRHQNQFFLYPLCLSDVQPFL